MQDEFYLFYWTFSIALLFYWKDTKGKQESSSLRTFSINSM